MDLIESEAPKPAAPPPPTGRGGCWKGVVIICLAFIASFTGLAFYMGKSMKDMIGNPAELIRSFFQGKVTVTASNILLEIGRTHGDLLEVASPTKTMEVFTQSDSRMAAWGKIYLGTTVTEIKVPATYRFTVKLSDMKDARLEGNVLVITAPEIKPSLPVAFDTGGIEKKSDSGWARFNSAEQLADHEKNLTASLATRATHQVGVVREVARKDIEQFVQKWIVDNNPAYRDQIHAIKVVFPNEDASKIRTETVLP